MTDPENVLMNAGECRRLSYDMLFSEQNYQQEDEEESTADQKQTLKEQYEQQLLQQEKKWEAQLREARNEAFEQGKQQGQKEAEQSMARQSAVLEKALTSVESQLDSLTEELCPHIATMVFEMVEKIIGLPIEDDRLKKTAADEIGAILTSIEQDLLVTVTVAATDYGFIVRALNELPNTNHINITGSEDLNPGEYTVDTESEHIVKNFQKILHDFREKVALENDRKGAEPQC